MKLPNARLALIAKEKIVDYLLNAAHPDIGGKAVFFASLGFRMAEWEVMARALRELAKKNPLIESLESPHGVKYLLDGAIRTPNGRTARVRTVWIIDRGRNCPRLVTAYPAET